MKNSGRILVVDDNQAIHEDFRKILAADSRPQVSKAEPAFLGDSLDVSAVPVANFELSLASQGEAGIALVKESLTTKRPFELAFVDMRMPPGLDGVETIKRIWEIDPQLQIVICTAYSDYTWAEILADLGVSERLLILKKPFDNAEVSQMALALSKNRRVERENEEYRSQLEDRVRCQTGRLNDTLNRVTESEQFLQSTLDALTGQVAIVDERGVILAHNGSWKSGASHLVTDRCVAQSNYLEFCRSVQGEAAETALAIVRGVSQVARGDRENFFLEYQLRDDVVTPWFTVRVTRFQDAGPTRIVVMHEDITEYKLLQSQLGQAQKLESIGQLAAGIAHEINTPMQYIGDNIECLHEWIGSVFELMDQYQKNLDETNVSNEWERRRHELAELKKRTRFSTMRTRIAEAIEDCRVGFERVTDITRAMKEFSHPGKAAKEGADLNSLITSAVTITRNRWKYSAEMKLDLSSQLPTIYCQIAEINQVLLNLIVNASDAIVEKFGEDAGQQGKISIETRSHGSDVTLEIADTGCGIPKEILSRVFDPFFTTKDVGKGTGQGLAICYNVVVNQHGGSLEVDSVPGEGTTFRVSLPTAKPSEDATGDDHELAAAPLLGATTHSWGDHEDLIG